ncbi:hypothetical protein F5Y16DRAFT_397371 [Xylariaceae sp. FL0255]|nr:hypothetical protein F5Y16DRAFT_397371 [Xylariaceae sp. FL0255]
MEYIYSEFTGPNGPHRHQDNGFLQNVAVPVFVEGSQARQQYTEGRFASLRNTFPALASIENGSIAPTDSYITPAAVFEAFDRHMSSNGNEQQTSLSQHDRSDCVSECPFLHEQEQSDTTSVTLGREEEDEDNQSDLCNSEDSLDAEEIEEMERNHEMVRVETARREVYRRAEQELTERFRLEAQRLAKERRAAERREAERHEARRRADEEQHRQFKLRMQEEASLKAAAAELHIQPIMSKGFEAWLQHLEIAMKDPSGLIAIPYPPIFSRCKNEICARRKSKLRVHFCIHSVSKYLAAYGLTNKLNPVERRELLDR